MKTITVLSFVLFLALAAFAQTGIVDPSFNPVISKNATFGGNFNLQPDGKILVFGNFQTVNGVLRNKFARFNVDGSLDATFNPVDIDFVISSSLVQSDGKIIIAGGTDSSYPQPRLYRLNSDGSRDDGFVSPFPAVAFPESVRLDVVAAQSDGKILVRRDYNNGNAYNVTLYRLNRNGSIDNTFNLIPLSSFGQFPGKVSVLPDDKIHTVITSFSSCIGCSSSVLKRYNPDGTLDSSFEIPNAISEYGGPGGSGIIDYAVQPDGSIIIVGGFNLVNGVSRPNIAKILPAGNVDPSFYIPNLPLIDRIEILSNGKFLLGYNNRIYRFNADGSTDNSFNAPMDLTQVFKWELNSMEKIYLFGAFNGNAGSGGKFVQLNEAGGVDYSFSPAFGLFAAVTALVAQNDGKIVIAGDFNRVGNTSANSVARINGDGSLDSTFNSGNSFGGTASKLLLQADGKILAVGNFFVYNNFINAKVLRLNADGSLDNTFHPDIPSGVVNAAALQRDGKILLGGTFDGVNGQSRTGVARLNPDGTLDANFNPSFGNPSISDIAIQSDDKILVGGWFNGANGFNRVNLSRLNLNGSLDTSFNAGTIGNVGQIQTLANGKSLVFATNSLLRLNSNGSTDNTFQTNAFNGFVSQIVLLPDESVVVGGRFSSINNAPKSGLARFRSDGSLDNNFFPDGTNGAVVTIAKQPDGKLLAGGDFSVIGGVTRSGIARLTVETSPTAAAVTIAGRVTDARGRGVSGAAVVLTDERGARRSTQSNPFGYYRFEGAAVGNYILTVSHKLLEFTPRAVFADGSAESIDFTAH